MSSYNKCDTGSFLDCPQCQIGDYTFWKREIVAGKERSEEQTADLQRRLSGELRGETLVWNYSGKVYVCYQKFSNDRVRLERILGDI